MGTIKLTVLVTLTVLLEKTGTRSIKNNYQLLKDLTQDVDPLDDTEDLLQQDAEVSPGLYEGDIALDPEHSLSWRLGLRWDVFPARRWDNNTVHYVISPLYLPEEHQMIQTAIYILNMITCVKFVPWDEQAKDYLLIWPIKRPAGCWSFVGKLGGPQILSLQRPKGKSKKCFVSVGKPIHELLHALGIFHEQSRWDRDKYVKFFPENVIPPFQINFNKHSLENTTYKYEYDYFSVMHYGTHFFSIDRKKKATLLPRKAGAFIGQRLGLSKTDCLKTNDLYGCFDGSKYDKHKYTTFCNFLGF